MIGQVVIVKYRSAWFSVMSMCNGLFPTRLDETMTLDDANQL
jgi:hypothetical protein